MYGLENVVRKHFYMRLLKNTDDDNMCAGVCVCACVYVRVSINVWGGGGGPSFMNEKGRW